MIIKAAVIGYGNIGKGAVEALCRAEDFELSGIVRRRGGEDVEGIKTVSDIKDLGKIDIALLCCPSRLVPDTIAELSEKGVNTVDSYDIHSGIWDLTARQDKLCKKNNTVSIVSAGWDPGTDSVIRVLMEAMVPWGETYTNFGPGMSMGHSVAAKAIDGVKDAVSITIPLGKGVHGREVFIELEKGFSFEDVKAAILKDPYFAHDKTNVTLLDSIDEKRKTTHGVLIEREGESGVTSGQKLDFGMKNDNPSLTAQIMVSCAGAAMSMSPGCYTLPEIPPLLLLPGSREDKIRRLV